MKDVYDDNQRLEELIKWLFVQMNVALKKINHLEAIVDVEVRANTWVDELDEDRIWKSANDLVDIMGKWRTVGRKIDNMESKIKRAGRKPKLEEVKKSQKVLIRKIEEVNFSCRNVDNKYKASLHAIYDEMERRTMKKTKYTESLAMGLGLIVSLVKATIDSLFVSCGSGIGLSKKDKKFHQ